MPSLHFVCWLQLLLIAPPSLGWTAPSPAKYWHPVPAACLKCGTSESLRASLREYWKCEEDIDGRGVREGGAYRLFAMQYNCTITTIIGNLLVHLGTRRFFLF